MRRLDLFTVYLGSESERNYRANCTEPNQEFLQQMGHVVHDN